MWFILYNRYYIILLTVNETKWSPNDSLCEHTVAGKIKYLNRRHFSVGWFVTPWQPPCSRATASVRRVKRNRITVVETSQIVRTVVRIVNMKLGSGCFISLRNKFPICVLAGRKKDVSFKTRPGSRPNVFVNVVNRTRHDVCCMYMAVAINVFELFP